MSKLNFDLWKRIDNFQFDKEGAQLSFSRRLARENDWSYEYALEVISEYKKFVYLCCISDEPVTPSDAVDQVWHLHLTYTRNYWTEFCANTLGQMLHHDPTDGGDQEEQRFKESYARAKYLYLQEFGSEPRKDIWPPSEVRFAAEYLSRRVRAADYLIISKYIIRQTFIRFTAVFGGLLFFLVMFIGQNNVRSSHVIAIVIITLSFAILPFLVTLQGRRKKDNNGGGCGGGCSGCGGGCGG